MIERVDWWCTMCNKEGWVTASVDVKETAQRVRKSHRKESSNCEAVEPFYRKAQENVGD